MGGGGGGVGGGGGEVVGGQCISPLECEHFILGRTSHFYCSFTPCIVSALYVVILKLSAPEAFP